jgi:hypothetical protein
MMWINQFKLAVFADQNLSLVETKNQEANELH